MKVLLRWALMVKALRARALRSARVPGLGWAGLLCGSPNSPKLSETVATAFKRNTASSAQGSQQGSTDLNREYDPPLLCPVKKRFLHSSKSVNTSMIYHFHGRSVEHSSTVGGTYQHVSQDISIGSCVEKYPVR